MPITIHSGANLKKLKQDELICHIVELYGFIDVFSNQNLLKKKDEEIEKFKDEMVKMFNLIKNGDEGCTISKKNTAVDMAECNIEFIINTICFLFLKTRITAII